MTPTKKSSISAEPFYCRPYCHFSYYFGSGQTADEVEAVSQLGGSGQGGPGAVPAHSSTNCHSLQALQLHTAEIKFTTSRKF